MLLQQQNDWLMRFPLTKSDSQVVERHWMRILAVVLMLDEVGIPGLIQTNWPAPPNTIPRDQLTKLMS
jgi:hypothetical protein